ncbi:DUF6878 family protein [Pseudorhodoplanes sp.]|uniref:DUF6878 family protein n=1 Tax=Pseudorhodoplanes sp. TaxID=1934341 RepID=UPI003D0BB865
MTDDNISASEPALDPTSWLAKELAFAKLCESIRPENKTAVFDALARAGITRVEVTFDGYADSGQIEDVAAKTGDKDVALPPVSMELARAEWGSSDIVRTTHPMAEAIERLAYDFLRETHIGWENNEGAYGDFYFDVAERTITLNYNERVETSEYTQHVF